MPRGFGGATQFSTGGEAGGAVSATVSATVRRLRTARLFRRRGWCDEMGRTSCTGNQDSFGRSQATAWKIAKKGAGAASPSAPAPISTLPNGLSGWVVNYGYRPKAMPSLIGIVWEIQNSFQEYFSGLVESSLGFGIPDTKPKTGPVSPLAPGIRLDGP